MHPNTIPTSITWKNWRGKMARQFPKWHRHRRRINWRSLSRAPSIYSNYWYKNEREREVRHVVDSDKWLIVLGVIWVVISRKLVNGCMLRHPRAVSVPRCVLRDMRKPDACPCLREILNPHAVSRSRETFPHVTLKYLGQNAVNNKQCAQLISDEPVVKWLLLNDYLISTLRERKKEILIITSKDI